MKYSLYFTESSPSMMVVFQTLYRIFSELLHIFIYSIWCLP